MEGHVYDFELTKYVQQDKSTERACYILCSVNKHTQELNAVSMLVDLVLKIVIAIVVGILRNTSKQ